MTEEELRGEGKSKTPDVLLTVPIGFYVNGTWRVVRWIDSKALFCDPVTHKYEVSKQAEGYVHRYGPGCVVYWFGWGGGGGRKGEEGGGAEEGWFWTGGGMPRMRVNPDGGLA